MAANNHLLVTMHRFKFQHGLSSEKLNIWLCNPALCSDISPVMSSILDALFYQIIISKA